MILFVLSVLLGGGMVYCILRYKNFESREKKQKIDLANAYQQLLLRHQIAVYHYENLGNRVFALDRKNKKLVVVDHNGSAKQELCVSLLSVSETKVVEEKNKDGFVRRIFLQLRHKRSDACYNLCFFDQSVDGVVDLPFLARCAAMWKNRIDLHKYPGTVSWSHEYVL